MAGKIGWEQFHFGALNVHDGECDIARNLVIFFAIPVAMVYVGAHHRIDLSAVKDASRKARLRRFLEQYYGWPPEKARTFKEPVDIPLKKRLSLALMAGLFAVVLAAGVVAVPGIVAVLVFATMPRPMDDADRLFRIAGIAGLSVFVCGLILYLYLRRPSPRQASLRAAVSAYLGPYTDLAEWRIDSLGPLFPILGIVSLDPAETVAEAESLRSAGKMAEALLWARVAIAFAHSREERSIIEHAEMVTDECLARLDGMTAAAGA